MQSKEEQLTSERVEARPMGISWAQLEHQDKVEGDEEEEQEEEMGKDRKDSKGKSWAEVSARSFDLLDPFRVKSEVEKEGLEALRSLGDVDNALKPSGFRYLSSHNTYGNLLYVCKMAVLALELGNS